MALTGNHIYYPSTVDSTGGLHAQTSRWYDLRTVTSASNIASIGSTAMVQVAIEGLSSYGYQPQAFQWPKTEFETAKQTSLNNGG